MTGLFLSEQSISGSSWQSFERVVCRLLLLDDYTGVRLVGQTSDKGADIIANKHGKR